MILTKEEIDKLELGEKQEYFAFIFPRLLDKIHEAGFQVRIGDVWAHDVGPLQEFLEAIRPYLENHLLSQRELLSIWAKQIAHNHASCHYFKIAVDINLFKDGKYLSKTEDHKPFGEIWKSLGGDWGGDWGDGNHYSIRHEGRR